MKHSKLILSTVLALFTKDATIFFRGVLARLIDTGILLFSNVVVFAYFMPALNTGANFGPFLLLGAIVSFGFFDVIGRVGAFIGDIDGDSSISYLLTMPMPSWIAFLYHGLYWAFCSMVVSLAMFPLGKLLLLSQFDLSKICYGKLFLHFVIANLFFGFFSLWLAAMLKDLRDASTLWLRVIVPMFMFGCYFYPFATLYNVSHIVGGISLLNPMVYAMEGMRAAGLGQAGFINFWICFAVLIGFTTLCAISAVKRLKRRLDSI